MPNDRRALGFSERLLSFSFFFSLHSSSFPPSPNFSPGSSDKSGMLRIADPPPNISFSCVRLGDTYAGYSSFFRGQEALRRCLTFRRMSHRRPLDLVCFFPVIIYAICTEHGILARRLLSPIPGRFLEAQGHPYREPRRSKKDTLFFFFKLGSYSLFSFLLSHFLGRVARYLVFFFTLSRLTLSPPIFAPRAASNHPCSASSWLSTKTSLG